MMICMEKEALGNHDEKWQAEDTRVGRSRPTEWGLTKARLPRNQNRPNTSKKGLAWRWLHRTLGNLLAMQRLEEPAEKHTVQAGFLRRALGKAGPMIDRLPTDKAEEWRQLLGHIQNTLVTTEVMEELCSWAAQEAEAIDKKILNQRRETWTDFLAEAAKGGAGGLHRLGKPMQRWKPRASAGKAEDQACPLQAAGTALASWSKEWQAQDPAKQGGEHPWHTYKVDLPSLKPGALVAVGRRCKYHTGVGETVYIHAWLLCCRAKASKPSWTIST